MKNKITCLLAGAALFGATANAEIVLTEDLSAYGYIDMALVDLEDNGNTTTSVAEFELGFSFTPLESKWSAVAELSFDDGDNDDSYDFETVTISYQYSDSLSFTFGNILSYQGFETYDATGLYQFSYAGQTTQDLDGDGNVDSGAMYSAAYAVGASADGSVGDFDFGIWIGDDAATNTGENSYEYLLAYNGIENLTVKAIFADDPSYETTNVWASYDYGNWTFAVESVDHEFEDGRDVDLKMAMAYYSFGKLGLTVRVTDGDYGEDLDFEKLTISPSYAFSDNVFGLIEFSNEELEGFEDADTAAVELIYSF
jgi:hypothetical protein